MLSDALPLIKMAKLLTGFTKKRRDRETGSGPTADWRFVFGYLEESQRRMKTSAATVRRGCERVDTAR